MNAKPTISILCSKDVPVAPVTLGQIMHESIHSLAHTHYSSDQISVWSPAPKTSTELERRLSQQIVFYAVCIDQIAGFMSLKPDGEIDFAYVLPCFARQRVSSRIYSALETYALKCNLIRLTVFASHLARPFFERHGFITVRANTIEKDGVTLNNWFMEKRILCPAQ